MKKRISSFPIGGTYYKNKAGCIVVADRPTNQPTKKGFIFWQKMNIKDKRIKFDIIVLSFHYCGYFWSLMPVFIVSFFINAVCSTFSGIVFVSPFVCLNVSLFDTICLSFCSFVCLSVSLSVCLCVVMSF